MRLLIFPNSLGVGGSQLNAVELASKMQDRGHEVVVFGPDGPLADRVVAAGMTFEPAPPRPKVRPSPAIVSSLRSAAARHGSEIVHGYEWPPILEAVYGPGLIDRIPVVGTVMSMGVAPFIPGHVPLVVGTRQIAEAESGRREMVYCIEPPVDVVANSPGSVRPATPPASSVDDGSLLVVIVSRLARELKLEGILTACHVVGELSREGLNIHLVMVGDGPARPEVEAAARRAAVVAGRDVVSLLGAVTDPRPWYAAADVAVGMGGSAVRAMAFGKPLIVQGELGFWELLTPETLPAFRYQGWYGIGGPGPDRLAVLLRYLAGDRGRRAELGAFSRRVAVESHGLDATADRLEHVYATALNKPTLARRWPGLLRPARQLARYEIRRRLARIRGHGVEDDFNAISAQTRARTPA